LPSLNGLCGKLMASLQEQTWVVISPLPSLPLPSLHLEKSRRTQQRFAAVGPSGGRAEGLGARRDDVGCDLGQTGNGLGVPGPGVALHGCRSSAEG